MLQRDQAAALNRADEEGRPNIFPHGLLVGFSIWRSLAGGPIIYHLSYFHLQAVA
jgi:hypothetical protein